MDPKETLRLADQAISDCEPDKAHEYLEHYRAWRRAGGFEPIEVAGTLHSGDKFAAWVARRWYDMTLNP